MRIETSLQYQIHWQDTAVLLLSGRFAETQDSHAEREMLSCDEHIADMDFWVHR